MANKEVAYKIAFSFLKKMNATMLREMESKDISPEEFFTLPTKELIYKLGIINNHDFDKIEREEAVFQATQELEKTERHNITPLFLLDEDYPERLSEIYDPPIVIYKLGEADLEEPQVISVVGTRRPTPYGVEFCNKLIDDLGDYFPELSVVSGLAYGIDAVAHKKALDKGLKTVAVVAHGLNMIYPAAHRNLAKEIVHTGGAIISEYPFGVKPYKQHFLARNRIVAGLSDATIVVESNIKGGAMSTANFAFQYNRDVMALPGRVSDDLSSGCNLLIRKNKAHLISSAADFIDTTGWQPMGLPISAMQQNLFPELSGDEKNIYELLKYSGDPVHIDQISYKTGLKMADLTALLGKLEFDGIIMRYPGNRFTIS